MQRAALAGLSVFYGCAVSVRNLAYRLHARRIHKSGATVVSVGNITAGGTGKTPFVAHLAQWFCRHHVAVGLLSRGYRAHSDQANDEKLVLDQLCPSVPHVQNPDRVAGASIACEQFGCRLLILDDGFQHRRLARDLDIVLVDALNPWGYGHLLPRGLLRESVTSLKRADLVVLTRADQCMDAERRQLRTQIGRYVDDNRIVEVAFCPVKLVNARGESEPLKALVDRAVVGFCGIGNPEAFQQSLSSAGLQVLHLRPFADHHHYGPDDLAELQDSAKQVHAAALVTTQKDLVKIDRTELGKCPLWALEIGVEVLAGEEILDQQLQAIGT